MSVAPDGRRPATKPAHYLQGPAELDMGTRVQQVDGRSFCVRFWGRSPIARVRARALGADRVSVYNVVVRGEIQK